MRKFVVAYLILLSFICVFIGCTKNNIISKDNITISEEIDIDKEYEDAYLNCIFYIENSSNANRHIDTSIAWVEILNENQKELVCVIEDEDEKYFKDETTEYWLFTIGDTKDHNYILLVCNSQSNNVIGSIPIK